MLSDTKAMDQLKGILRKMLEDLSFNFNTFRSFAVNWKGENFYVGATLIH